MPAEPTEDQIANFTNVAGVSREQAIGFLRANDLNLEKAINAYFENPTAVPVEYQYGDQSSRQFHIENLHVPGGEYQTPPTRPPSRMNQNDAPKIENYGGDASGSDQHLTAAQREERDLQQAVAMSLQQNLQDFPPQETGVTVRTEKPHFGRATRDHYDEHSWAMTLFNPSAREVIISPDPEDRRRRGEEPAFLRPSEESNYLAGFLTILHSIPLAREALLLRDKTAYDYGHDPQWWNGQPIKTPRVVSLDHAQEGDDDADELLYETQRLMAFLDGTRRAFGSTDALVGLKTMSGYDPDGGISKFLEGWQQAAVRAASDNPLAGIFASHALKRPLSRVESPITKTFFILDPNVEPEHGQTLYDVLDRAIWSDVPGEELDDVWLEHVGDVLTIRLEITETQVDSLDVKIPAVFYPDRYMEACREVTREIRLKRLEVIKQINRLEELAARLQTSGPAAECGLTNKQLLRKAAEAALTALPRYLPQDMTDMLTPEVENAGQALAAELDAIVAQLDAKLKELSAKRQEALESLRKYSKPLTEPSSDPNEPPNRKYTLRGVCTAPHITYVLRRKQPPKTDDHMDGSATSNEWQWWRISFSVDDGKTQQAAKAGSQSRFATPSHADIIGYTAKKVREIEVLRAARDESANVLLVYANENAVGFQDGPAPPALQAFVQADNAAFQAEIEGEQQPEAAAGGDPGDAVASGDTRVEADKTEAKSTIPPKVNVFDYEVSSFDDESSTRSREPEMQEVGNQRLL